MIAPPFYEMTRFLQRLLTCWLLGLLPALGTAQPGPEGYRFEHLTVNEGLSHSDAMCVVQDGAGFIWVGTNDGIDRYDGYTLKKYQLPVNTRNGLSGNRIRALHVDRRGRLWVGAESSGVSLFDATQDRFVNLSQVGPVANQPVAQVLSQAGVEAITSDARGRIWVGTYQHGAFVLDVDQRGRMTRLSQVALAGRSSAACRVSALVADRDGTLWIGTIGDGLRYVRARNTTARLPVAVVAPLSAPSIQALHLDRRGDLWLATNQRIFWVPPANRRAMRDLAAHPLPHPHLDILSIHLDSFGQLWAGTAHGLYRWSPRSAPSGDLLLPIVVDKPSLYLPMDAEPFSINSVRIHQMIEDRYQVLWLGTSAGGLNKVDLRHKPFGLLRGQIDQHPTLPTNYVNAIYKDTTHNWLWIGTRNGFSRYDLTTKTYRNYLDRPLPGNATGIDVAALFKASDGTLWVGTQNHGLLTLRGETLSLPPGLSGQKHLENPMVELILEDRYHTIWVATYNLGLLRFSREGKLLQHVHRGNSPLPTNQFSFLLYDPTKDILWASTRDVGVLKLKITPDSLTFLKQFSYDPKNSNSLSVNYAWPLLKDRRGTLWIGTIGGGLNKLTTDAQGREVVQRCTRWLPHTNVESLLEDEQGQLWLGGVGLVRVNPVNRQWVHYDVADGLQSNSFKVRAACRAADGTFYFGGINGITYFQPRQIQPNPYPPLVRLTGLRLDNKPVAVGETIHGRVVLPKPLDHTERLTIEAVENDFSVEFVGLNYANPQKHTYAYRLLGYNDTWVYPAPGQRTASFANLPAGDYTLLVKAGNGEGRWSTQPATLRVTVRSPWWKTGWAYLLYGVVVVGALGLSRRITLAQQTLKNTLALEKFRAEKEKEMTEVKLRFFTNVSHELRTPLTLILGPMEELATHTGPLPGLRDKVTLMHTQTRKLLDLVNQLMDFRKVESGQMALRASRGDVVRFLTEIFLIFKLKAEEAGLDYAMDAPAEAVFLYFDRSKLEITLTNLLSNAFKYTPRGGKIRVSAAVVGTPDTPALFEEGKLLDNYLSITVQDWGMGMEADEVDKIFNLYYQASQTETLRITGTGIGLSLVRQFVEAHAGEVTVQSAVGTGTTFTLRLPFGHAHLAPTDIREETPAPEVLHFATTGLSEVDAALLTDFPTTRTDSLRLLLVEDNEEVRQYLQQLFEATFEVFTAVDGLEGWGKTLSLLPDLVVSDVMMPRSDGLELCQKIKTHPKTMHIPVMLLTARVAAVYELEGLETGADEYMAKPFNPKILYAKVAALLQNRFKLKAYHQRERILEPTETAIPNADKLFLEKAMQIVEAHLPDPDFSVQVLVQEVGVSQSVFYRRIKSITGQSVVEFIRDVRMKRAAQLLASTPMRISEIAYQVGIEDLTYFRKTFQKRYNRSPSEYARQHRETEKVE